jgi:hypothetical protein
MADNQKQHHEEYSDALVDFLEVLWGEGYLSPGGAEEVARVLEGVDLSAKRVLDIGCGSGGIALSLAGDHGAAHVTGIDVEDIVLGKARAEPRRAASKGGWSSVRLRPGRCRSRTTVSMSSSARTRSSISRTKRPCSPTFIASSSRRAAGDERLADQPRRRAEPRDEALCRAGRPELRHGLARNLPPGAAGGRLRGHPARESQCLVSPAGGARTGAAGGRVVRPGRRGGRPRVVDHNIGTWRAMLVVLETGEHCPHHFHGRKPA